MPIKTGSFVLLLLAVAFSASAGQVYKWIDANGRVHYSDTPRPGWTRVDVSTGGVSSAAAAPESAGSAETAVEDAAEESPERARLRAEECQKRRDQLETYRTSTQIIERDNLGNERTYTEEQRLQLIEQTQTQVNELCAPAS
jgi:hypothetical protein